MGFWKWVVGFKDKACKIRAICDSPCQERSLLRQSKLHQEPKFKFNNGILEVGWGLRIRHARLELYVTAPARKEAC